MPGFLTTLLLALVLTTPMRPITRADLVLPSGIIITCLSTGLYLYDTFYLPCSLLPESCDCPKQERAQQVLMITGLFYIDLGLRWRRHMRQRD